MARAAVEGLAAGRAVVIPGAANRTAAALAHLAPKALILPVLAHLHPALKQGPRARPRGPEPTSKPPPARAPLTSPQSPRRRSTQPGGPMPQLVSELDLPHLDMMGLERREALDAVEAARSVHWLARTDLGYAVTRLKDVTAILRDQRFHSRALDDRAVARARGHDFPDGGEPSPSSPWRARATPACAAWSRPAFTPASANRLRPTMRAVVGELVDRIADQGECELVADVCEPYPIPIICELLGAPPEDWKLFSAWATDIFRIFNNNLAEDLPLIVRAGEELNDYVSDMIAERRADPRDDLLSDLIAIEEEGDRLSTEEMAMLAQAVLMAGTDTTRNQLACSVALFTEHPDQWALLAERPELAGRAVEESMRYLGAVRGTARFAAEDVVYRDVAVPAGDARGHLAGRGQSRPRSLRRAQRLRHHP